MCTKKYRDVSKYYSWRKTTGRAKKVDKILINKFEWNKSHQQKNIHMLISLKFLCTVLCFIKMFISTHPYCGLWLIDVFFVSWMEISLILSSFDSFLQTSWDAICNVKANQTWPISIFLYCARPNYILEVTFWSKNKMGKCCWDFVKFVVFIITFAAFVSSF